MTFAQDRHLQTGIAGSLVIHVLLLLLLVWAASTQSPYEFGQDSPAEKEKEPEVVLLFPDQIILEPPPEVEKKPQLFIRTTQNEESAVKPQNAPFQSDRNTIAASMLPPVPGTLAPMPTQTGTAPDIRELANRDYKNGEIKNDSAPTTAASPAAPSPPSPPAPQLPQPPQQPAQPTPPQPQTARAETAPTPLTKMMEEMDKEMAAAEPARLPLEVRKAESQTPPPLPDAPPPAMPQVRDPEDTPPQIVKAVPVEDTVQNNTPRPEEGAFSPFTRTSKRDGGISREGMDAVDAEATPLGAYMRQVTGAVERKWHLYVRLGKDSVTFGRVRFRFYVDKKGVPQDLKILSDARDADPRMRELTLRAILDAQIPPIPPDLLPTLDDERVKIEYEAIIY